MFKFYQSSWSSYQLASLLQIDFFIDILNNFAYLLKSPILSSIFCISNAFKCNAMHIIIFLHQLHNNHRNTFFFCMLHNLWTWAETTYMIYTKIILDVEYVVNDSVNADFNLEQNKNLLKPGHRYKIKTLSLKSNCQFSWFLCKKSVLNISNLMVTFTNWCLSPCYFNYKTTSGLSIEHCSLKIP